MNHHSSYEKAKLKINQDIEMWGGMLNGLFLAIDGIISTYKVQIYTYYINNTSISKRP